jgi:hypothetical protein
MDVESPDVARMGVSPQLRVELLAEARISRLD